VLSLFVAGVVPSAAKAADTYSIQDYFPLHSNSLWVLQDVDGEPADDEGFSWIVSGTGPQTIGAYQAWDLLTDAVSSADSRDGDRLYWNFYHAGADLGLYGLYENAGATPLAANQAIAFSLPLRVGTRDMAVGWSAASSANATFNIAAFGTTIPLGGTVAATATLAEHRDQLDTPLGTFYDIVVLTLAVDGSVLTYSLPLYRGTLFLARSVGLVRFVRTLVPGSSQAQAIASGQLAGVPIVPLPPPGEEGLTVGAPDLATSEAGDTARVTVVLNSAPLAAVTVALTCDDPTEARLSATAGRSLDLLFTPGNWDLPQEVLLTGLDDPDWDGHQAYHLTVDIRSTDPGYAGLDPSPWTLTLTNLDDEALDIEDYFVLSPGSHWHYVAFDERSGPVPGAPGLTWTAEDEQPLMHGVPATAIRTDLEAEGNPLNGAANIWSVSPSGDLLLHGARLPVQIERDVELMGETYHAVVPPQTVEFATPLLAGTRGMVAHAVLSGATTASVEVTGLPLFTQVPIDISSRVEVLGLRESKLTPLGSFAQVPFLQLTISVAALGESLQDQGGVLFLARGTGVICQNAVDQPEAEVGMALSSGTVGTAPIVADDPTDRVLSMTIPLQLGWNLIAIPFEPATPPPSDLFGDAILGCAWELRGRDFTPARAIRAGHGYWVYRNPAFAPGVPVADLPVIGKPATRTTRAVRRGWVLAGLISDAPGAVCPLPIPSVPAGQPACRVAWACQDGQLIPVRQLTAGAGAWLLVETTGTIDLAPP